MKIEKKSQIIAASVAVVLIVGVTAFAKTINETAEIFYNNIKIYIDGAEIVPKDANGNIVEPFTMNGTTYLPVRAISNAFGQDVEWDGTTQSVYIGKKDQTKPDNYLQKIQYNDYKKGQIDNYMSVINGTVTDYNGKVYTNGILFGNYGVVNDDSDEAGTIISYPLNSQYSLLKGNAILPKSYTITTGKSDGCKVRDSNIYFYGDGKLIYKVSNLTPSMPFNINIDVRGVNQLTIKIATPSYYWSDVALTDLALYK